MMRRKRYVVLFLVFLMIMTAVAVFGKNGLLHVFRLRRELMRLTTTNQLLRLQNDALLDEIRYLREHEVYLELHAHKQGLVREDEIILQFTGDK